jgi:DNA-binding beta-propeller fold protein YncE
MNRSQSFRRFFLAVGTSLATTLLASTAMAGSFVALSEDQTLQMFDSTARKVTATIMVKGLGAPLAGIDVRPADGMVYGLQRDGQIVTIDIKSGQATPKAKLDQMLPTGVALTVDFNPVADRMRVVGADGTNLRINVDDGKTIVDGRLKFADADTNKGAAPFILAGAYSNKFKGTKETALYEIDAALGALVKQVPPNDGVLNTLGSLGAKPKAIAFNIEADGKGGNTGWLLADGTLSMIDIGNGQVRASGPVSGLKGSVRDIAVLPAM